MHSFAFLTMGPYSEMMQMFCGVILQRESFLMSPNLALSTCITSMDKHPSLAKHQPTPFFSPIEKRRGGLSTPIMTEQMGCSIHRVP